MPREFTVLAISVFHAMRAEHSHTRTPLPMYQADRHVVPGMEFQLSCYGRPRKFMITSVEAQVVPGNDVVQQYGLHALPYTLPSRGR